MIPAATAHIVEPKLFSKGDAAAGALVGCCGDDVVDVEEEDACCCCCAPATVTTGLEEFEFTTCCPANIPGLD